LDGIRSKYPETQNSTTSSASSEKLQKVQPMPANAQDESMMSADLTKQEFDVDKSFSENGVDVKVK
jgi:hypothetical protein